MPLSGLATPLSKPGHCSSCAVRTARCPPSVSLHLVLFSLRNNCFLQPLPWGAFGCRPDRHRPGATLVFRAAPRMVVVSGVRVVGMPWGMVSACTSGPVNCPPWVCSQGQLAVHRPLDCRQARSWIATDSHMPRGVTRGACPGDTWCSETGFSSPRIRNTSSPNSLMTKGVHKQARSGLRAGRLSRAAQGETSFHARFASHYTSVSLTNTAIYLQVSAPNTLLLCLQGSRSDALGRYKFLEHFRVHSWYVIPRWFWGPSKLFSMVACLQLMCMSTAPHYLARQ